MPHCPPDKVLIFGYGSLLRDLALAPERHGPTPALLSGYRRSWDAVHSTLEATSSTRLVDKPTWRPRPYCAFLSLEPCAESQVPDVVFSIPLQELPGLDRREVGYFREDVSRALTSFGGGQRFASPVFAYRSAREPVEKGEVFSDYAKLCRLGAEAWDRKHPGFLLAYESDFPTPPALCDGSFLRLDEDGMTILRFDPLANCSASVYPEGASPSGAGWEGGRGREASAGVPMALRAALRRMRKGRLPPNAHWLLRFAAIAQGVAPASDFLQDPDPWVQKQALRRLHPGL
jgi:hypothetical protein